VAYRLTSMYRQDLMQNALKVIPKGIDKPELLAETVVRCFGLLSPPSSPNFELITVVDEGREGGASQKFGNLFLDWTLLFRLVPDVVLTATSAHSPWLLPFIALHVWNAIAERSRRQLSPRHAIAILALWKNRDERNCISETEGLLMTNKYLSANGYSEASLGEYANMIDTLCDLNCIDLEDGVIHIKELVIQERT